MNNNLNDFVDSIEILKASVIFLLSSFFGKFWFLFIFLLFLNLADIITGVMKARTFKQESSKASTIGLCKKIALWVLIFISFGLSLMFIKLGEVLDMKMDFMLCLGWGVTLHCIINEFRSILENIIEMDINNKIVPKWLVRGLEVYQKTIEERFNGKIITNTNIVIEENKASKEKSIDDNKNKKQGGDKKNEKNKKKI